MRSICNEHMPIRCTSNGVDQNTRGNSLNIEDARDPLFSYKDAHAMVFLCNSFRGEVDLLVLSPELVNFIAFFVGNTRAEEPPEIFRLDNRVGGFLGFLDTKYFNAINLSPIVDDSAFGGLTDPTHVKSAHFGSQTWGKFEWGGRERGEVISRIRKVKAGFPLVMVVTIGSG